MLSKVLFQQLVNETIVILKNFILKQIITPQKLTNYSLMSRSSLHSWLESCLIEASRRCNLVAVPEMKLHYDSPLDPNPFATWKKIRRKIHQKKVDVAYYNQDLKFLGFSEVLTVDMAHGCLPSNVLIDPWLSPRDTFPFTAAHCKEKPKFILLMNILPDSLKNRPWKTSISKDQILNQNGNDYYSAFINEWHDLIDQLRSIVQNTKLITLININNIQIYP